jgi:uncharacterized PurR-regulated membrane protein YhhQ (DUF165 family)
MWVAVYIASIVAVNWLFVTLPFIDTPLGAWSAANIVVGLVFVLRDMAQRQLGHFVLLATLAAGFLTYLTVDPAVALASVTAFLASEMADWAVYSFTRRPLESRILLSSAVASPLDTVVFLGMMGFLSPASFSLETASKLAGALVVWILLRRRLLTIGG